MKKYCMTYGNSKNKIIGRDFYNTYEEADAMKVCILGLYNYVVIEEMEAHTLFVREGKK